MISKMLSGNGMVFLICQVIIVWKFASFPFLSILKEMLFKMQQNSYDSVTKIRINFKVTAGFLILKIIAYLWLSSEY